MASSHIVTANTSVCSKCSQPPFQARYPLVECSQFSRLFHTTCLIKSYADKKKNLSCADCKKCMNASMRESQQSRQSSASTSKTNVRKSAGSGVAISAARQTGNSNKLQTIKALGQTTSSNMDVRRVSGLQAASTFTLVSNSTKYRVTELRSTLVGALILICY